MENPAVVFVPVAIILFGLIYAVVTYNGLVNLRNLIRESWADVDTELKRRYDLIPNLVATVKGYAQYEKDVLERVVAARVAVVERYPDLKASEQYLALQRELVNTEDRIQAARRFFNGNVRDYNNKVEMFPSSIIAGMGGFRRHDFFEIAELERAVPSVS
ncbi:MAG: LemA family protein [Planctomycetota bacterium]